MTHCQHEPNAAHALAWWSELPAKWTPFGWKDHLFRFNLLYNGMISAVPNLNRRTEQWKGQGVQLGVTPNHDGNFPGHVKHPQDNGMVVQGWTDDAAPVLWSEWSVDAMALRATCLGHILGAASVETGIEPLFAWVRLSVHDTMPGMPLPETYHWNLNLNGPYISTGAMSIRYNIAVDEAASAYPRALTAQEYDAASGLRVTEPDGTIRLGILPGHDGEIGVVPGERDYHIWIAFNPARRPVIDLLLPMLPTQPDVFEQEFALGYDKALAQANAFWSATPAGAARFETPEAPINLAIDRNLRMAEIIAERNPAKGEYTIITGSWTYADVWATPTSMQTVMLLDAMGHHATAEKYLRVYADYQGQTLPHGDYFEPHHGSLGAPEHIAAIVWTSDHGALMWALAKHALMAGQSPFIDSLTDVLVKGCEFIVYMRHIDGHGGVVGLIPPGIATDMPTKIQSVWADAWNHLGMRTAIRYLKRVGHPRAAEFEADADDYRATFQQAIRAQTANMPTWTDDEGNQHHIVPMAVYNAQDLEYRNAFYLDTGPLLLVWTGLLEHDDPLMVSTLKWFRQGPPTKFYRYDGDCWQVPALHREMSSCEPCYSFNVFHSWRWQDRQHYLEGLYSLFLGSMSRQTQTSCETRGGVTGVTGAHLPTWLARLALVDDEIEPGALHLLRLVPRAWLSTQTPCVFDNAPTEFGPLDLRAQLSTDGRTLQVTYTPKFRTQPSKVVLHKPPIDVDRVQVNGEDVDFFGTEHTVLSR